MNRLYTPESLAENADEYIARLRTVVGHEPVWVELVLVLEVLLLMPGSSMPLMSLLTKACL